MLALVTVKHIFHGSVILGHGCGVVTTHFALWWNNGVFTNCALRLPDGAKLVKYYQKSLFSKKFADFFAIFFVKFCHFRKYQWSILPKQSIFNYLSNEYRNFGEKIQLNMNHSESSKMHQIICLNTIIGWRIAVIIAGLHLIHNRYKLRVYF